MLKGDAGIFLSGHDSFDCLEITVYRWNDFGLHGTFEVPVALTTLAPP